MTDLKTDQSSRTLVRVLVAGERLSATDVELIRAVADDCDLMASEMAARRGSIEKQPTIVIADPGEAGIAMAKRMHPDAKIVQKTAPTEPSSLRDVWLLGQFRRIWLTPAKTVPRGEVCWCGNGEAIATQKLREITTGIYRPREADTAMLSVSDYKMICGFIAECAV